MAKGGFTGAVPPRETSPENYSGVWDITEQYGEQKAGSWPFQADDNAPKSLRLSTSNNGYLTKTPSAAGDRKTWTWSAWIKRNKLGTVQRIFCTNGGSSDDSSWFAIAFNASDQLFLGGYTTIFRTTVPVYRDVSAWMHCVVSIDLNASTTMKLWMNGVEQELSGSSNPSQTAINSTLEHRLGREGNSGSQCDLLIANVEFVDGQALEPTDFGFYDGQGIWQPKRFTGDYSSGPVYSNFLTSSGTFDSANPPTGAFDGIADTSNRARGGTDDILTFDISSFGFTGLFEFWSQNNPAEFSIDGGSTWSAVSSQAWTTASSDITGVTSIKFRPDSNATMKVSAFRSQGQILTDASVGRNSFHLDLSDGVKDQTGLGNNWTNNNLDTFSGSAESSVWESGDSGWTIASDGSSATEGGSNGYQDVFTGLMEVGKVYAFTTSHTNGDANGGWWFGDSNSTSLSGTHPNQGRGTNSLGQRGRSSNPDDDTAGAHGTFATANSVTASDSALSGFSDINPYGAVTINWVVDRVTHKVWAKVSSSSTWVKLGDPSDSSSTPTFHLPSSGDLYFGFNQYNNSNFTISIASYSFTADRADDIFVDSPVNGNEASTSAGSERRGNYATLNPLAFSSLTLVDGNLQTSGGGNAWLSAFSTIKTPESGKWFYECTPLGGNSGIIGIFKDLPQTNTYIGDQKESYGWYGSTGNTSKGPGNTQVSYNGGATFTNNDVIGVALDLDAGTLTFYKNGTSQGVAFSNLSGSFFFAVSRYNGDMKVNFGQRPFKHPVSGFSPLATSFLPEPAIKQGNKYVDVALWTGNNNGQTLSGFKFSPDLVWVKNRDSGSYGHRIVDKVRGATYRLQPHATSAQGQELTGLTAFNDDGFTLGDAADYNTSGNAHLAWMWDAGEATTTISAGGSNSQAFDQSERWRDNITSSNGWNTSYPVTNIFNGAFDGGGGAANNGNGGSITFTPPNAITVTKLELSVYNDVTLTLPDGTTQTIVGVGSADRYVEADIGSGFSFTGSNSITLSRTAGFIYFERIRINGKELVDDDITINTPEVECKVRANQAAGFSIVKVDNPNSTSARVHGLSKAPEFIICKSTASADSWHTYWAELGRGYYINIYPIGSKASSDQFGSQEPNPVSFYVKTNTGSGANKSGGMIYYLWHSVEGFSKFSSYTGTGGDVFVYCGFRPRLITFKNADQSNSWLTYDTARDPSNVANRSIQWDNSYNDSQITNDDIDILSNGFVIKNSRNDMTGNGHRILFGAWAEHPFASNCRAR